MEAVNEALRAQHVAELMDNEQAIGLYDRLCECVLKRPEGMDDAAQHLIAQVAGLELMKALAWEDIKQKGLRDPFRNGRQTVDRENRSVGTVQRCIEAQRKLMAELRITPQSRRDAQQGSLFDDGFAGF